MEKCCCSWGFCSTCKYAKKQSHSDHELNKTLQGRGTCHLFPVSDLTIKKTGLPLLERYRRTGQGMAATGGSTILSSITRIIAADKSVTEPIAIAKWSKKIEEFPRNGPRRSMID
ncbi:uncharacterized protein [Macrobrachium rosenbergii]|uniref:uncharacterized protein isoform X2 n=1 Tax=Macrobrachium rosenbergii TaxID=79674 RepID=UPI0034D4CA3A